MKALIKEPEGTDRDTFLKDFIRIVNEEYGDNFPLEVAKK